MDPSRGNPGYEKIKSPKTAGRKAGEEIVLGKPARPARALDQKVALFAVERPEMRLVSSRDSDVRRRAQVEGGFVVDKDDVRRRTRRLAGLVGRNPQLV